MSRVRIYQCNTYKKQNTLSPVDEPLELHIWDNLLFVSTKSSMIEIYTISSLQLVGKFSTISQAETLIYSEYGNCIVTMERADSNALHCFVRLYMGFPCPLIDLAVDSMVKESFLVVGLGESESSRYGDKYMTGGMTRCTKQEINKNARNTQDRSCEQLESWDVERVELPTQAAVNCVGICSDTGFLVVAWDVSITLYTLTQDIVISEDETLTERKAIKCGVTVLMEMEIGFVVTTLVVEDIYLACLSEFEVQVLKLQLMPRRYTSLPKEKKLSSYLKRMLRVEDFTDESEPEIQRSDDFIQLRSFYSYPAIHVGVGENGRDTEYYPGILEANMELADELENKQVVPEEHCIIFPSVSRESMQSKGKEDFSNKMVEIWGPSIVIENRALKVVTPDGHKLTNSGISTMLYLKLPPTVSSCTEYTLSTASTDKVEKSIDVFHTLKLIPEYLNEGEQQHLVGMCLLVASKKEGHFYDIFDYCRKINTFPFTKDLIDIVMSPGLMHVVYLSRVEVYITRSYGVASENARDLIKQGKVYNIDFGTAASTPSEEELINTACPSGLSIITNEERLNFQSPLYWLYQVSPSPQEMDISQIGQSIFMNLNSCTNTDNRIAILSKYKPEVKPNHSFPKLVRKNSAKLEDIVWSIYILDITPLHSIAKQMEIMAQPYIDENPPIYFQLLCDAHFLRKSAITREQTNFSDEDEVECVSVEPVDSIVISLTPTQQDTTFPRIANTQQQLGLQRSCLLLADFLRQENEQLALQYYKQASYDLNQFLQNSIFYTNTSLTSEDMLSAPVYTSLTPSALKSMASTMCFSQSDASLLAKSLMHKESLSPGGSELSDSDSMVHRIFLLCVHLENDHEMKAREAASELTLNSKVFSVWANQHINTFVSQDNEGNLSNLGMFLLIEAPTLIAPLLPTICEMGLVRAGHMIELIKYNTEDTDRAEMILEFITDLIRIQSRSGNEIQELDLAIEELIVLCLSLFENQIELETRKIDSICAEFRPNWLDCLPPFSEFETDGNIGNLKSYIFMVQNILCSPFNSLQLSEKILELVNSSDCYVGLRAVLYLKLGRYRDLVLIFLFKNEHAFPVFCDSIQFQAVRYTIIRCIASDILENTWESDMLSLEMREKAFYFIVSLTRCMTFKEILEILPEESPADLYKRCFDYHLHIEKSNKIIQDLTSPDF